MSQLTLAQLAVWRQLPEPTDPDDVELWQLVLDAVEEHFTTGGAYTAPEGWAEMPTIQLGLFMQAHRLLKRPSTPDGVAGFGPDLGIVRLSRFDPDIDLILGPYRDWNFA